MRALFVAAYVLAYVGLIFLIANIVGWVQSWLFHQRWKAERQRRLRKYLQQTTREGS